MPIFFRVFNSIPNQLQIKSKIMKTQLCLGVILILLGGCGQKSTEYSASSAAKLEELLSQETRSPTPHPTMQPRVIASPTPEAAYTPEASPSPEVDKRLPKNTDINMEEVERPYIPSVEEEIVEPIHTPSVEIAPQIVSMLVAQPAAPQPNLAATSPEVQEVLLQYTPNQITDIASQIASHTLCSASAVQKYYGGSLDYCKAYQVLTDAQLQRSAAFTNQYGNQLNHVQSEGYQRQSIQTDQDLYEDARRRSFNPGN
jgi:hypothetical protein